MYVNCLGHTVADAVFTISKNATYVLVTNLLLQKYCKKNRTALNQ